MRALIIDSSVKARIAHLKEYADRHRLNLIELKHMMAEKEVIGDNPLYAVNIPDGFRVVFTIEEQPPPMGWSRHISISIPRNTHGPNPFIVNELLTEFGFTALPGQSILAAYHGKEPHMCKEAPTWAMYLEPPGIVNVIEKLP
jgi:hypothetical protein